MISITEFFRRRCGYFAFSLLSLFILFNASCKNKVTPTETETDTIIEQPGDTLPGDFADFYDRFHTDSVYQLEHIVFPLEGLPHSEGDHDTIRSQRHYWQRADWKKHNHFNDPSGTFEHWYEVLDDKLVDHYVQLRGTNMVIHRRFAKLDDEWFLIYYAGLRPHDQD